MNFLPQRQTCTQTGADKDNMPTPKTQAEPIQAKNRPLHARTHTHTHTHTHIHTHTHTHAHTHAHTYFVTPSLLLLPDLVKRLELLRIGL